VPRKQHDDDNDDEVRSNGEDERARTDECGWKMHHFDRYTFDLQANKQKVLRLIADIFASGESNEVKERKLDDIIADLETIRRRVAEQKAASLKVSPFAALLINLVSVKIIYKHGRKSRGTGGRVLQNLEWGTLMQIVPRFCHVSKFKISRIRLLALQCSNAVKSLSIP